MCATSRGSQRGPEPRQVLATLPFTDIVGSTDRAAELGDRRWRVLLETHDDVVRTQLARFQGRDVETTGDGFLAVFDGPAARCGAPRRSSSICGPSRPDDGAGAPDEVLVSSVVRDLSVGSGLGFTDRGAHALTGVPGAWQVHAAT